MNMAARERKFFVGGNWKMNGTKSSIDGIVEFLKTGPLSPDSGNTKVEVVSHISLHLTTYLCYNAMDLLCYTIF